MNKMIKTRELRIGNRITYAGKEVIVKGIVGEKIYFKNHNDQNIEPFYEPFRKIQLTEDILLKYGAIKLETKDFPCFNLNGIQINLINGKWVEYVNQIEISGLHHLQNIYYFKYNKELE